MADKFNIKIMKKSKSEIGLEREKWEYEKAEKEKAKEEKAKEKEAARKKAIRQKYLAPLSKKLKYHKLVKKGKQPTVTINLPVRTEKKQVPLMKSVVEEDRRQFFFGS